MFKSTVKFSFEVSKPLLLALFLCILGSLVYLYYNDREVFVGSFLILTVVLPTVLFLINPNKSMDRMDGLQSKPFKFTLAIFYALYVLITLMFLYNQFYDTRESHSLSTFLHYTIIFSSALILLYWFIGISIKLYNYICKFKIVKIPKDK